MNIKKKSLLASLWSFLDILLNKASYFIATLILARIIGPKDFGLIGIIAVFLGIGMTFVDSGLSTSLIRAKDVENDYSTVFICNIILSFLVYIFIFIVSPFVAKFYEKPILEPLIKVYCFGFVLIALRMVHQVILTKNLQFKEITLLNIPGNLVGLILSLSMALRGFGVWSLIGLYISSQFVTTVLYWFFLTWRPQLKFSVNSFKKHFSFGYKLMFSANLNTIFDNIYNLIIGKTYSIESLSYYERAYTLNNYPISTISGVISKITVPLLLEVKDNSEMLHKMYRDFLMITFFITCPLMLGSLALADPLISLLLGVQWKPATKMFQILCLAYMLYPIHSLNLSLLSLFGRSDFFLKLEILKKVVMTILLITGMFFGIYGLIWSSVIGSFSGLFINAYYSKRLIEYSAFKQIKDIAPIFLISIAMSFIVSCVDYIFKSNGLLIQLILSILIGIISFLVLANFFLRKSLRQIYSLIK